MLLSKSKPLFDRKLCSKALLVGHRQNRPSFRTLGKRIHEGRAFWIFVLTVFKYSFKPGLQCQTGLQLEEMRRKQLVCSHGSHDTHIPYPGKSSSFIPLPTMICQVRSVQSFLDLNWIGPFRVFEPKLQRTQGASKESRKWPADRRGQSPCATETGNRHRPFVSRSGWRIMGKPRFCRLKHEWIAHIANTTHGFRNLSRNQVIIFDINSLWVFAGQRSGASHLANVVQKCICKIWPTSPHARHSCHGQVLKHKRNPISSQWSSWMLSYFQDQSWANLHLTFGMDWLLPGHWSFRLCRIFSLLSSSLLAWTRPTWICKSSHTEKQYSKLFVIAIIMVYARSVFCLFDRKWVQWRIGVARFVTPTRHEAVRSLLLWLVSDCQHCSSHMTEPRRNDARGWTKIIQLN